MPLQRCNPTYNYQALLFTGGPWAEGMDPSESCVTLNAIIRRNFGDNIDKCESVFETSSEGYRHFHSAVLLKRPAKTAKVNKVLLKHVRDWIRDPAETRQPNVGAYYVPAGGTKPRWQILDDYLRNPSKEKDTGLVVEEHQSELEAKWATLGIKPIDTSWSKLPEDIRIARWQAIYAQQRAWGEAIWAAKIAQYPPHRYPHIYTPTNHA